ncbi:hypothetical protein T440DRAFT_539450 [Plenodomus tracheiphilus IPT5]|uniref:Uncharacterized protein n=1 Tax=Plenodomus tracheiphilus IPT5 TaxID=1408161 RepID=A0A6A7BKF6_9PLEO|nr:hypothetical protein T440DRAFT_539450 [Plenodomus tracheiphilus IPT5]
MLEPAVHGREADECESGGSESKGERAEAAEGEGAAAIGCRSLGLSRARSGSHQLGRAREWKRASRTARDPGPAPAPGHAAQWRGRRPTPNSSALQCSPVLQRATAAVLSSLRPLPSCVQAGRRQGTEGGSTSLHIPHPMLPSHPQCHPPPPQLTEQTPMAERTHTWPSGCLAAPEVAAVSSSPELASLFFGMAHVKGPLAQQDKTAGHPQPRHIPRCDSIAPGAACAMPSTSAHEAVCAAHHLWQWARSSSTHPGHMSYRYRRVGLPLNWLALPSSIQLH